MVFKEKIKVKLKIIKGNFIGCFNDYLFVSKNLLIFVGFLVSKGVSFCLFFDFDRNF